MAGSLLQQLPADLPRKLSFLMTTAQAPYSLEVNFDSKLLASSSHGGLAHSSANKSGKKEALLSQPTVPSSSSLESQLLSIPTLSWLPL